MSNTTTEEQNVVKLLEEERKISAKREANLLGQIQDLRLIRKRLLRMLAQMSEMEKYNRTNATGIRLPAPLFIILLALAGAVGVISTILLTS